jgi:hypothetical protein
MSTACVLRVYICNMGIPVTALQQSTQTAGSLTLATSSCSVQAFQQAVCVANVILLAVRWMCMWVRRGD